MQTVEDPAGREENLHYGQLDFSNVKPEASCDPEKDGGRLTVYEQIKVPVTETPTPAGPEELYCQVKKT